MGWWSQSEEGVSFAQADSGEDMVWGDEPADIVDNAVWQIKAAFVKDQGRLPTKKELMAGLTFSTAVLTGLPETVAQAQQMAEDSLLSIDFNREEYERNYWHATGGDTGRSESVLRASQEVGNVLDALEVKEG